MIREFLMVAALIAGSAGIGLSISNFPARPAVSGAYAAFGVFTLMWLLGNLIISAGK